MNRRSPVAPVAAAVIAGVTTLLLFRLSHRQSALPITPPAPSVVDATSASQFSPILPIIDEANAPPVKWSAAVSGATPSPRWKIAFECYNYDANRTDLWTANGDGSDAHRILTDAQSPCWSPQRRMLAFVRGGNVWVANADGTNALPITFWSSTTGKKTDTVRGITWNAHDNVLSFARDDTYHLTNEDGSKRDTVHGSTIYHLALKPVANAHATVAAPFAPVAYQTPTSAGDTDDRAVWRRIPPRFDLTEQHGHFNFAENDYPAWSPSGTKLAFVREGDVWLASGEAENGHDRGYAQDWMVSRIAASAQYDGHTVGGSHWIVAATGVTWAPDESWLVYGVERISGTGQDDLHILRHRKAGWKEEWQDSQLKNSGDSPCISADGHWILYTSRGTLYAMTPDQKTLIRLVQNEKNAWCERAVW